MPQLHSTHLSVYGFNGGDAIAVLTCLCPDSMEGMVLRSSPVRVWIQWRGCYSLPHLSVYRFNGGDAIAFLRPMFPAVLLIWILWGEKFCP